MAGIYIHIPFCKHKCGYCNFFSVASLRQIDPVVEALLREIELTTHEIKDGSIGSVYFGGGTPSVLHPSQIQSLLDQIRRFHTLAPDCEITLEANPDDISQAHLDAWIAMGIRRISIGIQSFHQNDLTMLDRRHLPETAMNALELLAKANLDSYSVDLIYAIPGQTNEMLRENLVRCINAGTPHLSCYSLTIEPNTALKHQIDKGLRPAPNEHAFLDHWNLLTQLLPEAGYLHYETSNFSLPGHLAVHNVNYWKSIPYLGIGPSAHSYNGTIRRWNHPSLNKYIAGIASGSASAGFEVLSPANRCNEYIMTRLRTMWGLDLQDFEHQFGALVREQLSRSASPMIADGLLQLNADILMLTTKGKPLADHVTATLFQEL
jgi:oxygen-independent coproporphyrinogen III oxidase